MMLFSFFPEIVLQIESKISGEIVVKRHFGSHKLYVDGVIQSGGVVRDIWRKPLAKVFFNQWLIPNVLILGSAGGTVVQLIKTRWPGAKIVGIEIDPKMIHLGNKYFGLKKIAGLKIIQADAFEWLKKTKGSFDLVIVDMYLGPKMSPKATSNQFLNCLKRLLVPQGRVIFNWLKNENSPDVFELTLKKYFGGVEKINTASNFFFLTQNLTT